MSLLNALIFIGFYDSLTSVLSKVLFFIQIYNILRPKQTHRNLDYLIKLIIRYLCKLDHFSIWNISQNLMMKVISSWSVSMADSSPFFEFLSKFLFVCLRKRKYVHLSILVPVKVVTISGRLLAPSLKIITECNIEVENKHEFQELQQNPKTWKISGDIKGCFELVYLEELSCYNTDKRF